MLFKKELSEYNRYQAFAIHMAISLVIFFVLLACITQLWYPGILFDTGNGWKAIGMIVGIDLILGPLLTLIVFNPKKSSLKLDLSIIALVQTAALIYGTWTIHTSRPVALAFIYQSFSTIYANAPFAKDIEGIIQDSKRELIYLSDTGEKTLQINPEFFKDYADHTDHVINKLKSLVPDPTTETYQVPIANLSNSKDSILIDSTTGSILKYISKNKADK